MRPMPMTKHIVVIDTAGQIETHCVSHDIRPTRDDVVLGTYHRGVGSVGKRYRPFYHGQSWRALRAFFQNRPSHMNRAAALERNRIPNSESQQRDNIERWSLADVHIRLVDSGDYPRVVQHGDFRTPNDPDPWTLARGKLLTCFFQSLSCQKGLVPRRDQQSGCDNEAEALDCQLIETCNYASPDRWLIQGLCWFVFVIAIVCILTELIIGGGSRTTSVLLFGVLLIAIAFVLSQCASAFID